MRDTNPWRVIDAYFHTDRNRNRYNDKTGQLEVSKIFDWFKDDWQSDYRGIGNVDPIKSREQYFGRYAKLLADSPAAQEKIAAGSAGLAFLDYDWSLNVAR